MAASSVLLAFLMAVSGVEIVSPEEGGVYDGNWLTVRAIVENDDILPDSVSFVLNGDPSVPVPRLSTDWYTYMADDLHRGFSESPAPMDDTILWTAPVTGTHHEFPTPVVVDGMVYYPQDSTGDSLYALDAATGEVLWKYFTGYTDDAVTVKDGLLYTSSDSLWCLNAITGERVWANGQATSAASTPAVDADWVYNCRPVWSSNSTWVYCLDRFTGDVEWSVSVPGYAASCLTIWDGKLYMPTYTGPLYALNITDGSVVWQNDESTGGYWDSSPVIVDGDIYILGNDSYARAFDASTGAVIWETAVTPGTYLSATPAYHDGRLYFGDQVDSFHSMDCAAGGYLWSVPGVIHGSPGVADGVVFFGEGSNYYDETAHVFAYDITDGSVIWSYETTSGPYGIVSSPSIVDGVMYIAGTDGNLYAFGTGLKYTYLDDLFASVGTNELIVTSYYGGSPAAADTITFTVNGTGIEFGPSPGLGLRAAPNPFSSFTSVSFTVASPGMVSVSVYDMTGREVASLVSASMEAGKHSVAWDGMTGSGESVSPGIYLCRMESMSAVETVGLCVLR